MWSNRTKKFLIISQFLILTITYRKFANTFNIFIRNPSFYSEDSVVIAVVAVVVIAVVVVAVVVIAVVVVAVVVIIFT